MRSIPNFDQNAASDNELYLFKRLRSITPITGTGDVNQKFLGTQSAGNIPYWTPVARELSKGNEFFRYTATNGEFVVGSEGENYYIKIEPAATLEFGDISQASSGSKLTIDDITGVVTIYSGFFGGLILNPSLKIYQIGDVTASNNQCYVEVDDNNYLFNINGAVIRGNGLHNNGNVSQGGAGEQDVRSGNYTPTLLTNSGFSTITPGSFQWMRVGNVVTVSGLMPYTIAIPGTCRFELELPIGTDSLNTAGVATTSTGVSGIVITGATSGMQSDLGLIADGTISVHCTYVIED